jgi:hypothetical protein
MLKCPIMVQAKHRDWNTICSIALNNGYPLNLIAYATESVKRKYNLTRPKHNGKPGPLPHTYTKSQIYSDIQTSTLLSDPPTRFSTVCATTRPPTNSTTVQYTVFNITLAIDRM